jgi:hypothetical protein
MMICSMISFLKNIAAARVIFARDHIDRRVLNVELKSWHEIFNGSYKIFPV